jgi:pilus assembly protein CpaE
MEPLRIAIALETAEAKNAVRSAAQSHGLEVVLEQPPNAVASEFLNQVSRLRPDVVFIETARLWGPLYEAVGALSSTDGAPAVAVIHSSPDPEAILEAMRAGAAEFIYPPLDHNTRRSLDRLLVLREGRRRPAAGNTLAFLSVKGGCGATTIACHMATELQRSCGKSVLLADFDRELGMVAFLLKTKSQYGVADALENAQRLDRSMWQAFVAAGPNGVHVLNAAASEATAGESEPAVPAPDRVGRFFQFVRSQYDMTVVDLGRGVTRVNLSAMADIDYTCLVTTMDIPALHRARRTIRTLLNGGYTRDRMRLIVNRMPKHQDVSVGELEKMIEFPVYATVPEDDPAVSDAYSRNGVVAPSTTLGRQISVLAARLTGQPGKEQRKFRLFARA